MHSWPVDACLYAALLMVWSVHSEPSCDQTEFLHLNGTCVACPVCGPGEQLSEDCGFGDGGEGICTVCNKGTFSPDTSVAPCTRCTQCNLLNRLEKSGCSSITDALCGQCLPGYYELRSMTGEVEPACVPCHKHDTVHKECLLLTSVGSRADVPVTETRENFQEPKEKRLKEDTFSVVLIGSATASSIFVIALLLWAFLLTTERFKHVPEYCSGSEGLLSGSTNSQKERIIKPPGTPSQKPTHTDDPLSSRGLSSLSHENEVHPTSIVINVTTNIKSSNQNKNDTQETERGSCLSLEEMEQKLQKIWEVAQDQSIEMLDYDSVQDLCLLLDSVDNRGMLRRLGRSLGVPPHVNTHLQGFQDLFQYLRTSTYTLLPQLAQAAALLPSPEVVARIHRAVVTK